MRKPEDNAPDEELLIRYVLGTLPEDQADPFDVRSITDEDFAARLSAVEHDLVDDYVRGELRGETLEHFESSYLFSGRSRNKVAFARALLALQGGNLTAAAASAPGLFDSWRTDSSARRRLPGWALLAATLAIVLTSGYLILDRMRTRTDTGIVEVEVKEAEPEKTVEEDVPEERITERGTTTQPSRSQPQLPNEVPAATLAVLLLPKTRGESRIPTIEIPDGAGEVSARLQLEFDDFPRYEVALKDPATDRILWRSDALPASSEGKTRVVVVRVPAAHLERQSYSLELSGKPAGGSVEYIGNYTFRAVLE